MQRWGTGDRSGGKLLAIEGESGDRKGGKEERENKGQNERGGGHGRWAASRRSWRFRRQRSGGRRLAGYEQVAGVEREIARWRERSGMGGGEER